VVLYLYIPYGLYRGSVPVQGGTGSFPGVKSGQDIKTSLTLSSAVVEKHENYILTPAYGLYRASVPLQGGIGSYLGIKSGSRI
jgi:hypothetical protein